MIHMLIPTKFDTTISSSDVIAALRVAEGEDKEALESLDTQGRAATPDWGYGVVLIRDEYFATYARYFAEDLEYALDRLTTWPYNCIDWAKAAEELQMDYTSVTFDDVTYWVR